MQMTENIDTPMVYIYMFRVEFYFLEKNNDRGTDVGGWLIHSLNFLSKGICRGGQGTGGIIHLMLEMLVIVWNWWDAGYYPT